MSSILGRENRRGRLHVVVSGGGALTLAPAVGGKRHKIVGGAVSMATADGTLQFLSGSTPLTGVMEFQRRGGMVLSGSPEDPEFETEAGEALILDVTGGVARGWVKIITEE